ncbi:ABC transporter substrate-binding protein [Micromonospora sp. NPDC005087]|uniref:ABC transporter substrate-binding protein n=1 Tax=Micromonospora sp. NPDC005087 TaxID=3364225 RepID=UPI0036933C40
MNRFPRTKMRVAVSVAVVASLAAASSACSSSQAGAPGKIRYAIASDQAPYWPLYIGEDQGFFAKNGVNIEISRTQSGSGADLVQLLAAGAADMAGGLPDPVIAAVAHGAKLRVLNDTGPAPYALVLRTGLTSVSQLGSLGGNAKIAVSSITTATAPVAEKMLSDAGVDRSKYDFVVAGGSSDRLAAVMTNTVDAAVMLQPYDFTAEGKGLKVPAYSPDSVPDYGSTEQTTVDFESKNCDTLRKYYNALREIHTWFMDSKNKDAAIAILAKHTGVTDAIAAQTYELYVTKVRPGVNDPTKAVETTTQLLIDSGNLKPADKPGSDLVSTKCVASSGNGGN